MHWLMVWYGAVASPSPSELLPQKSSDGFCPSSDYHNSLRDFTFGQTLAATKGFAMGIRRRNVSSLLAFA